MSALTPRGSARWPHGRRARRVRNGLASVRTPNARRPGRRRRTPRAECPENVPSSPAALAMAARRFDMLRAVSPNTLADGAASPGRIARSASRVAGGRRCHGWLSPSVACPASRVAARVSEADTLCQSETRSATRRRPHSRASTPGRICLATLTSLVGCSPHLCRVSR